jgi:DNA-binding NarL/FixJ family response regulator
VVVADDQPLIRAGLAALLRAGPGIEVVGEAADGGQAVEVVAATRPDVVLMDIRMPGVNGITATGRILASSDTPPKVVILTTFDLDDYVYDALRAGACGFLLKDSEPHHLIDAVRAAVAGDVLLAPTVTRRLVESFLDARTPATPAPVALDALTPREVEVLRLVGTGLGNADIAATLTLSEATVKTHVNRAMSKLGLASRAQAVVVAYESGLVVPGRCPPSPGQGSGTANRTANPPPSPGPAVSTPP